MGKKLPSGARLPVTIPTAGVSTRDGPTGLKVEPRGVEDAERQERRWRGAVTDEEESEAIPRAAPPPRRSGRNNAPVARGDGGAKERESALYADDAVAAAEAAAAAAERGAQRGVPNSIAMLERRIRQLKAATFHPQHEARDAGVGGVGGGADAAAEAEAAEVFVGSVEDKEEEEHVAITSVNVPRSVHKYAGLVSVDAPPISEGAPRRSGGARGGGGGGGGGADGGVAKCKARSGQAGGQDASQLSHAVAPAATGGSAAATTAPVPLAGPGPAVGVGTYHSRGHHPVVHHAPSATHAATAPHSYRQRARSVNDQRGSAPQTAAEGAASIGNAPDIWDLWAPEEMEGQALTRAFVPHHQNCKPLPASRRAAFSLYRHLNHVAALDQWGQHS